MQSPGNPAVPLGIPVRTTHVSVNPQSSQGTVHIRSGALAAILIYPSMPQFICVQDKAVSHLPQKDILSAHIEDLTFINQGHMKVPI